MDRSDFKGVAWGLNSFITATMCVCLIYVASFRFTLLPVYPPLPARDYALQAAIAISGCIVTFLIFLGLTFSITRDIRTRRWMIFITAIAIIMSGLAFIVAAFEIPGG